MSWVTGPDDQLSYQGLYQTLRDLYCRLAVRLNPMASGAGFICFDFGGARCIGPGQCEGKSCLRHSILAQFIIDHEFRCTREEIPRWHCVESISRLLGALEYQARSDAMLLETWRQGDAP